MFKKYGVAAVAISSILALATPVISSARDRDDDNGWQSGRGYNYTVEQPYSRGRQSYGNSWNSNGYGNTWNGNGYWNGWNGNGYRSGGNAYSGYISNGYAYGASRGYEGYGSSYRDRGARTHNRWDSGYHHDDDDDDRR